VAVGLTLGGCVSEQSMLAPQGPEAARVALLFWVMTAGGGLILLLVCVLVAIAMGGREPWRARLAGERIVIGGGLVFPVVTLSLLLGYGLLVTRANPAPPHEDTALRIAVVGEQWWWRVRYRTADGREVESANEIRLPVGRAAILELTAADVIHSLWIPKLAGKLDMIPGRTNYLRVVADAPGVSRGQCAEYCGGAHALMSLYVVALEPKEFDAWLAREAAPASAAEPTAIAGARLFQAGGCGACHTVRGSEARGTIGPDLTHVGSRMSLAAATLPNSAADFVRWIRDNQHIKPENKMPPYRIFSDGELAELAAYLQSLK
jgi:cytochrome c oxidase subunit 2